MWSHSRDRQQLGSSSRQLADEAGEVFRERVDPPVGDVRECRRGMGVRKRHPRDLAAINATRSDRLVVHHRRAHP